MPRFISVIGILEPCELRCAESFLHEISSWQAVLLCVFRNWPYFFSGKCNQYPFQILEEIVSYFYYRYI